MVGWSILPSCPTLIQDIKAMEWIFLKELYHERHTRVFLCKHKKHSFRGALKMYSKKELTPKHNTYIQLEINVHTILNNIHGIVPLWFYKETDEHYYLMTKYMNQDTLLFFMYKYTTEACIIGEVIYPLLKILSKIHTHHIVHRDLKPENIFVHNGIVHIGDFGYSSIIEEDKGVSGTVGTIQYMAPELLIDYLHKQTNNTYKYELDIWAIGIITYELLFHQKPFGWSSYYNICKTNPTDPAFIKKCLEAPLEFPTFISEEAKDFLQKTLEKDPHKRMSIQELIQHDWILNHLKSKKLVNETCPLQYDSTQIKNRMMNSIHLEKKTSKNHCILS